MTNNFAIQLAKLRKDAGLSQAQLADQLQVSRQSVSKWENGTVLPDIDRIIEISNILQVSLDELVLGKQKVAETSMINKLVNYYLESDKKSSEWRQRPVNNIWEFLARYWWVLIALFIVIGCIIGSIT
ncbi:XRE family transcriptional regulator [Lactobacillus sp. 0.1XD8-4]|uniref:XRE family transcriptional regulator n=1 Tax=Limosilactobacillus walteri TaxID=2268022 RepID=A0ABR8P3Z8_9LACO|nr:helix-turn-helix transcriptional regulator [Limosilactobacillus walteri]MBD5805722.1 XRE family transcriptional regulator [Limosilactobacillus walteri]MRN07205.1 XRE family transcriptional regulator [Lactobacillus sp. 0.1XD8-4]